MKKWWQFTHIDGFLIHVEFSATCLFTSFFHIKKRRRLKLSHKSKIYRTYTLHAVNVMAVADLHKEPGHEHLRFHWNIPVSVPGGTNRTSINMHIDKSTFVFILNQCVLDHQVKVIQLLITEQLLPKPVTLNLPNYTDLKMMIPTGMFKTPSTTDVAYD